MRSPIAALPAGAAAALSHAAPSYRELRRHELRKSRMLMIDGNLTLNLRSSEGGISARAYAGGYWGFASMPGSGDAAGVARVQRQALDNARGMAGFGERRPLLLGEANYRGEHVFRGRAPLTEQQAMERMSALHVYCRQRYPKLKSIRVALADEHHSKWLDGDAGPQSLASIQRALCYVFFIAEDAAGAPVELFEPLSCKGSLADLELAPEVLAPMLDALHGHVRAKCEAVPARGGQHAVVMAPALAGMLAHEAMGHPCEADLVLGGAVTGDLLGQQVASEKVTMVDLANRWRDEEAMAPVYVDDEGTPAVDVTLIERGRLAGFMHSRETAARMAQAPTGNARAYGPGDEPLVRMRNTVILPGADKIEDMIAGVDDGYLLMKTGNGQADSTTEFMFGITLGYEIKGGRIGRAIRDTTLSGSAIKVLQTVDAVGDTMDWNCSGYCGKKQPMVVSMGGPALRARAHLGGE